MMMPLHTFHIPVMGIGYTIDTPLRVAHLGISSAISLVDDGLVERMREHYSKLHSLPFNAITSKMEDFRAKRLTAYLNMVNELVTRKYNDFKANLIQKQAELNNFITLLPDTSILKEKLSNASISAARNQVVDLLNKYLQPGSIDVNIMTKLDKENYREGTKLPTEYNDAHAALRGYATSALSSSLILSAGMNARLYSYLEQFNDFYPDEEGNLKKKIILKVSDYRSALIQGRILAKKGLWVSEFRVESGLNCGGHTFATQGYLLGPILEEFRDNRDSLAKELGELFAKALEEKKIPVPSPLPITRLTAQGGVGTAEEHNFLMEHYKLDGVGWGSPFLLVPEAVSIDKSTIDLLANSAEDDYYLSDVSPVGVRFNNVRGATADTGQAARALKGKPGAPCTKQFLLFNTEFSERPVCTASIKYQESKIKSLRSSGLNDVEHEKQYQRAVIKSCICNGLGASTLESHGLATARDNTEVSVCPGPNLAYFSREATLREMVDHIYGRTNLIAHPARPNFFIKELTMYLDFIDEEMDSTALPDTRALKSWNQYLDNLRSGINYYHNLFKGGNALGIETTTRSLGQLQECQERLEKISCKMIEIEEKTRGVLA